MCGENKYKKCYTAHRPRRRTHGLPVSTASSWTTCCWTGPGWRPGRTAGWSAAPAAACSTWAPRTAVRWPSRTFWPRCWSRTGRRPGRTGTPRRTGTATGPAVPRPTGCTGLSTRTAWPTGRGRRSADFRPPRTAESSTGGRERVRPGCTAQRWRCTTSAVWSPRRSRPVTRSPSNLQHTRNGNDYNNNILAYSRRQSQPKSYTDAGRSCVWDLNRANCDTILYGRRFIDLPPPKFFFWYVDALWWWPSSMNVMFCLYYT